jgi:hypothetical protein
MAKAAFNGRYSKVETPAAAPIPALEALPPSVVSLDGGRDSWLHAEGDTLTMPRARTRATATSLNVAAV